VGAPPAAPFPHHSPVPSLRLPPQAGAAERADGLEADNQRLSKELEELRAAAEKGASAAGTAAAGEEEEGAAAGGVAPRPRQPAGAQVLALNVSGREVWAARPALARLPGPLRDMFGGGGEAAAPCDVWGRPYL
jgi:hypothetical protein